MVVSRYLAGVTLVSALIAGCDQSLFDANLGGGGSNPDGAPGPEPDGGSDRLDGGPDAPPSPDASPPPAGIADDAVGFFSLMQGGTSGRWQYREIEFSAGTAPAEYDLMRPGQRLDMYDGWIGTGSPSPAILSCVALLEAGTPYAPCSGVESMLLFETTSDALEQRQPMLGWTAPITGVYRLGVQLRLPAGLDVEAPPVAHLLRNSEFDTLSDPREPDQGAFELDVHALEGDSILLAARPQGAPNVPVGVTVSVIGQADPGPCELAFRFQEEQDGTFPSLCRDAYSLHDVGETPTEAGDASLPFGIPGSARKLVPGSVLQYQGGPIDYSGDWTVQFWARLDGAALAEQWLLSDLDCSRQAGIAVAYDGVAAEMMFELAYQDGIDDCAAVGAHAVRFPAPPAGTWHFFRFARRGSTAQVFMDGAPMGTISLNDAAAGIPRILELGRRNDRSGGFAGQLADLRVFSAALPRL